MLNFLFVNKLFQHMLVQDKHEENFIKQITVAEIQGPKLTALDLIHYNDVCCNEATVYVNYTVAKVNLCGHVSPK